MSESTPELQTFTAWRAYGETLIVSGSEPVWLAPGEIAEKLAEIDAVDYEAACREWNASLSGHDLMAGTERLAGNGRVSP